MLNQAVMLYAGGTVSRDDIDKAAKYGLTHPMGPLMLLDMIGLDVFASIMQTLHDETGSEAYKVDPVVKRMLTEHRLGRKSGGGFYEYRKGS